MNMMSRIVLMVLLAISVIGISYGILSNQFLIKSDSFLLNVFFIITALLSMSSYYKRKEKILAFLMLCIFILLSYTFLFL
ncbi:hypothetical protein DZB91_16725 [Brevibacillus sp. VP]|uniref:Uncharacterized protein n=1 Tax=Brevibacillus laterosporus TaxID=1465 RepID=A0AAP8Q7V8_BRELA|nr:hypothetical protein [Brevibacillus laterosporus]PPA81277.1 hypothetical protein C4A76_23730 [Brevibacillus laterosporus]PPA90086.1 hypothetical protein C4A77_25605 [Brevibacillus laterosporus]RFB32511.1 hypothetical protein DZB91_16725 [Brevibacillus sp. VP]